MNTDFAFGGAYGGDADAHQGDLMKMVHGIHADFQSSIGELFGPQLKMARTYRILDAVSELLFLIAVILVITGEIVCCFYFHDLKYLSYFNLAIVVFALLYVVAAIIGLGVFRWKWSKAGGDRLACEAYVWVWVFLYIIAVAMFAMAININGELRWIQHRPKVYKWVAFGLLVLEIPVLVGLFLLKNLLARVIPRCKRKEPLKPFGEFTSLL